MLKIPAEKKRVPENKHSSAINCFSLAKILTPSLCDCFSRTEIKQYVHVLRQDRPDLTARTGSLHACTAYWFCYGLRRATNKNHETRDRHIFHILVVLNISSFALDFKTWTRDLHKVSCLQFCQVCTQITNIGPPMFAK